LDRDIKGSAVSLEAQAICQRAKIPVKLYMKKDKFFFKSVMYVV